MRRRLVALALLLVGGAGATVYATSERWLPYWEVAHAGSGATLIDAGTEPRQALAYDYQRAPRSFYSVGQSGLLEVRGVLQNDESYAPPVMARWEAAETSSHFGVTRIEWRVAEARLIDDEKVEAKARAKVQAALDGVIGLRLVTYIGQHGQLRVEPPRAIDPMKRRLVDDFGELLALQMAVPLPSEPVGRGARWAAERARSIGPAGRVLSRSEYQLTGTDGDDGFEVAVKLELKGDPQEAVGAREHIVVDQIEGSGEGRIVRMRREPTPVQSDLVYQVAMSVTPLAQGQAAPTDAQRIHGYRVALRTRQMMQATDVGPLDWSGDVPEAPVED